MNDSNSLAHTKWNCKYHVVFAPKYRRKVFYKEKRKEVGKILRMLCEWKKIKIVESVGTQKERPYRANAWVSVSRAASSFSDRTSREMSRSLVVISSTSISVWASAVSARAATPQLVTISSPNRFSLE